GVPEPGRRPRDACRVGRLPAQRPQGAAGPVRPRRDAALTRCGKSEIRSTKSEKSPFGFRASDFGFPALRAICQPPRRDVEWHAELRAAPSPRTAMPTDVTPPWMLWTALTLSASAALGLIAGSLRARRRRYPTITPTLTF